jgi:hypothetical protein
MAPFTSIFSQLIGGQRVTNVLTTLFCLAPLVGAALGTVVAPLCLQLTDSFLSPLVALPAGIGTIVLLAGRRRQRGPSSKAAFSAGGRHSVSHGPRQPLTQPAEAVVTLLPG